MKNRSLPLLDNLIALIESKWGHMPPLDYGLRVYIFTLLFIISVTACRYKSKEDSFEISNATEYKKGFIELNYLVAEKVSPTFIGLSKIGYEEYLTILNNKNLLLFSIDEGSTSLLHKIEINLNSQIKGYYIDADSTVFIASSDSIIRIFNFEGEFIDSIVVRFQSVLNEQERKLFGVFYEYPFIVEDKWIYIYAFPTTPVSDLNRTNQYYSKPFDLIIEKSNPDKIVQAGKFPEIYFNNKYYVYSPSRAVNSSGLLIYSFASESELFLFDVETGSYEYVIVESNYFRKNSVFDLDKLSDFDYISQYLTENSRYGKIIYDKYGSRYLRVCFHPYNYRNPDGTINRWIEKPWSILVIGSDFNIEKEILFPNGRYDARSILVCEQGVLVARLNLDSRDSIIVYDVFEF